MARHARSRPTDCSPEGEGLARGSAMAPTSRPGKRAALCLPDGRAKPRPNFAADGDSQLARTRLPFRLLEMRCV